MVSIAVQKPHLNTDQAKDQNTLTPLISAHDWLLKSTITNETSDSSRTPSSNSNKTPIMNRASAEASENSAAFDPRSSFKSAVSSTYTSDDSVQAVSIISDVSIPFHMRGNGVPARQFERRESDLTSTDSMLDPHEEDDEDDEEGDDHHLNKNNKPASKEGEGPNKNNTISIVQLPECAPRTRPRNYSWEGPARDASEFFDGSSHRDPSSSELNLLGDSENDEEAEIAADLQRLAKIYGAGNNNAARPKLTRASSMDNSANEILSRRRTSFNTMASRKPSFLIANQCANALSDAKASRRSNLRVTRKFLEEKDNKSEEKAPEVPERPGLIRMNSKKMALSGNEEDEQAANTMGCDVGVELVTELNVPVLETHDPQPLRSCLKQTTDMGETKPRNRFKLRKKGKQESNDMLDTQSDKQKHSRSKRRQKLSVRFAVNPAENNRVWTFVKTFEMEGNAEDTWWGDDELEEMNESHFEEIDEETEDLLLDVLMEAMDSVSHTTPHMTDPSISFSDFLSCGELRGLEKAIYDFHAHVDLHRSAVLDTQKLMEEEHFVGGLDDNLFEEILSLRSIKYSHPCRMLAQKMGELDHEAIALYHEEYDDMHDDSMRDDSNGGGW